MDSRKVIGAKATYGITDLFVFKKKDGNYGLCLMEGGVKKGWPEETYPDLKQAADALANHAYHSLVPEDFRDEEKPRIEDLHNWAPLYKGELPEACLHPREGRAD